MKKIFIVLILFLIIYIMYELLLDREIKYLYIGNTTYDKYNKIIEEYYREGNHTTYIRDDDYRVVDLINEISDNKIINKRKIQNLLVKSNIITISIGLSDLSRKELDYKYVDEFISDIERLIILIRKYNKDKIYFLGYYNKNMYYDYINNKLNTICKQNNITFINIEKPIYKQIKILYN